MSDALLRPRRGRPIVRIGVPLTGGRLVAAARDRGLPVLFSANAFARTYPKGHERAGYFRDFSKPDPAQFTGLDAALDSAGFVAAVIYGDYRWTVEDYFDLVQSHPWAWYSSLDFCCEPEVAGDRPLRLLRMAATVAMLGRCQREALDRGLPPPMPVLQGWTPDEYIQCASWLALPSWPRLVGIGSVCRRNVHGKDGIAEILAAVDDVLPRHVKLHLFGVKSGALEALGGHPRVASVDSMAWDAAGETGLYITLSETTRELRAVVRSHGWTLEGIEIQELGNDIGLMAEAAQTILHPSEIELGETIKSMTQEVERLSPRRVVFDSLSEMRLLAQDPLRYRRQILALKHFFADRDCTVLLLDDKTSEPTDLQLHSIAHGVISLEQEAREFGAERRALRIVKMRGVKFQGGWHDFVLDTGVVEVFPRLIAADHHARFDAPLASTGSSQLDEMLGGGIAAGTNMLLLGPSGAGKTTTAIRCMLTALERGERVDYYLFDEGVATLLERSRNLGMALDDYVASGHLVINQIDPASLSPGEFASRVVGGVSRREVRFVGIDSLNAYVHAMPGQNFLILHMHELLTYLNQQGVITFLIVGQHGLVGEVRSNIDLSYLSDAILLYRYFEAESEVRTAVAVLKSRTTRNERSIRELRLGAPGGIQVGDELRGFDGVLAGAVAYSGPTPMLTGEEG